MVRQSENFTLEHLEHIYSITKQRNDRITADTFSQLVIYYTQLTIALLHNNQDSAKTAYTDFLQFVTNNRDQFNDINLRI